MLSEGALVFFSYAPQDKWLRDRLEDHLSNLKYRGLITSWHDKEIRAGDEWAKQIHIYLDHAHIILLLISPHFMASDYCYSVEMMRALERHEQREAYVVPILLRPVLFTEAPFAKLQMLPSNGKPVMLWRNRDSAFVDVALFIERIVKNNLSELRNAKSSSRFGSSGVGIASPAQMAEEIPIFLEEEETASYPALRRGRSRRRRVDVFMYTIGFLFAMLIAYVFSLLLHASFFLLIIYVILGLLFLYAFGKMIGAINRSRERELEMARGRELEMARGRELEMARGRELEMARERELEMARERKAIEEVLELERKILESISRLEPLSEHSISEEVASNRNYYLSTIGAYQKALLDDPFDADAFRGLGTALYALGCYDVAIDAFLAAEKSYSDDDEDASEAFAGLANVYAKLKWHSKAVRNYEYATKLNPNVTFDFDDIIQSFQALGRTEEAEQVRTKAVRLGYESYGEQA